MSKTGHRAAKYFPKEVADHLIIFLTLTFIDFQKNVSREILFDVKEMMRRTGLFKKYLALLCRRLQMSNGANEKYKLVIKAKLVLYTTK